LLRGEVILAYNDPRVVEECPAFQASDNTNFANFCPETSPVFPCEPVHGVIAELPGCITPTGFNHVEVPADNTW